MNPQRRVLASARIPVLIVSSSALARAVNDIDRLRKLYREKGIQYAIVYALHKLGEGLGFSDPLSNLFKQVNYRRI